jgi:hypothetical protein
MQPELNLNIDMVIFAIKNRKYNCLSLYCALKFLYPSGNVIVKEINYNDIKSLTKIKDNRTINTLLKQLVHFKWIKINTKNSRYYLLSNRSIYEIYDWDCKILVTISKDLISAPKIMAFAGAAMIAKLYRAFWIKFRLKKIDRMVVDGIEYRLPYKGMYQQSAPIAITAMSKIFQIPVSTVDRLKKLAIKNKLVQSTKKFTPFGKGYEYYRFKAVSEEPYKLYRKNGMTVYREIDELLPKINFKKMKMKKSK